MSEFNHTVDEQVASASLETSATAATDRVQIQFKEADNCTAGSSIEDSLTTTPLPGELDAATPAELSAALEKKYIAARYQGNGNACTQLLAAADNGNHLAEAYISIMYTAKGCLVLSVDAQKSSLYASKALPWLQAEVANSNKFALFALGWLNQKGIGVTKNEKEAVQLYTLAAEQGSATAQFNLGKLQIPL